MRFGFILKIIGALLILGVVGTWVYLLLFAESAPVAVDENFVQPSGSDAVFAPNTTAAPASDTPAAIDSTQPLSQLSTRRVAGAVIFEREDKPVVRFVEQGTGHVYELSLTGGPETRVSNRTFARTQKAIWAPTGNRVAIVQETDTGFSTFVGSLQRGDDGVETLTGETLPAGAENVAFSAGGDIVYYTTQNTSGSTGVSWNIASGARQNLFATPLRDITVSWNPKPVIFTKPAAALQGYAYTTAMASAGASGNGLIGEQDSQGRLLATRSSGNGINSTIGAGSSTITLDLAAIPEKCAFTNNDRTLVCGVPETIDTRAFPDSWYRGQTILSDVFWTIDTTTGRATFLASPLDETGRELDVIDFSVNATGAYGVFINKTDASLWLLRR